MNIQQKINVKKKIGRIQNTMVGSHSVLDSCPELDAAKRCRVTFGSSILLSLGMYIELQ